MQSQYDNILRITDSRNLPSSARRRLILEFAYDFGWRPSDFMDVPIISDLTSAHLVVEHGLEHTAVISFLRSGTRYSSLNIFDQQRILSLSYNNLIDWHLSIEPDAFAYVYNRTNTPTIVERGTLTRSTVDQLRSSLFDQLVGRRPSPNVLALDDALINTISYWKRELAIQLPSISNEHLSQLFNAIIFARATEDLARNMGRGSAQSLLSFWDEQPYTPIRSLIALSLQQFNVDPPPTFLINEELLAIFDGLDSRTVQSLLWEFYRNKFAPYEYDFSLISKHALSRIYERYVAILKFENGPQATRLPLFPDLPSLPREEINREFGAIYTPQYIARFFAKYLRKQVPQHLFKALRTIDPAVGSGIFLRTLLELQLDSTIFSPKLEEINNAFENTYGIDIDDNATHATKLSLSLLHLVLTDGVPRTLNIISAEALEYFVAHPELAASFDVVVANPPYVSLDTQDQATRERVANFLSQYAMGRRDLFLAFLRLGLELLKPGGYGLFVLPHSFLLSSSGKNVRDLLASAAWIRCVADLTEIRVFRESDTYVVLLIFQKKSIETPELNPKAMIVKCYDWVGQALEQALDDEEVDNNAYSIYHVEQDSFKRDIWAFAPPIESDITTRLEAFPTLDEFLKVREGFTSGADDVFILDEEQVPYTERDIYVPFLPDRLMQLYTVPNATRLYFFYPYIGNRAIIEDELRINFAKTWEYLLSRKDVLQNRTSVKNSQVAWWRPTRPREPQNMMRPKIISPHLALVPRFSLDLEGKYAVSRAPLLHAYRGRGVPESDILRFFTAVLNSTVCFWYVGLHSHKYGNSYVMLEPKTLNKTPVPDYRKVSTRSLSYIIELVDRRIASAGNETVDLEQEIDEFVASELYGLTPSEKRAIGMV